MNRGRIRRLAVRGALGLSLAATAWSVTVRPLSAQTASVCTVVKLELAQKAALEREAFNARLLLTNNQADMPLSSLRVTISIKDSLGNPADALFFNKVTDMAGVSGIDGSGTMQPAAQADVKWLIIPSPGAGGSLKDGTQYSVTAQISYVSGATPNVNTTQPAYITVYPQPLLSLEYLLPFEVFGVDPFTLTGTTEPFPLGLRVSNVGAGTAVNFQIASGQPGITDNKQGLPISFQIIGAFLNSNPLPANTLTVPFGNIPPGGSALASWQMTSSFSGRFIDFSVTATHDASLGGALTSLIQSVTTYTVMKDVLNDQPGRDAEFDLLVNVGTSRSRMESDYQAGLEPQPDALIDSDRPGFTPVLNVPAHLNGALSGSNGVLSVVFDQSVPTNTWVHASIPFPQGDSLPLRSVIRADGKPINPRNAWIAKHIDKLTNSRTYFLHVLDHSSSEPAGYAMTFDAASLIVPPDPISNLSAQAAGHGSLALSWNATGAEGSSGTIVGGRYAIFASTDPAAVPSVAGAAVSFSTVTEALARQDYLLTGLLGNATYFVSVFLADASGNYSGASNLASAETLAGPPRNVQTLGLGATAFALAWDTGANAPGTQYQIELSSGPGLVLAVTPFTADLSSIAYAGLDANKTYFVAALERNNSLALTPAVIIATEATLALPPGTTSPAFPVVTTGSVVAQWLAGGNPPDTEFFAELSTSPTRAPVFATSGWVRAASFTFADLPFATTYYGQVKARNRALVETAYADLGAIRTISGDDLPPRTSLAAGSPQFGSSPVYIATGTLLSLSAADDRAAVGDGLGLGVAQTFIAVDSGTFTVYTGTFTLVAQGTHTVQFYSVDLAGNVEAVRGLSILTDAAPPATVLSISTPVSGGYVSGATRFSLAAVDPVVSGGASGLQLTRYRVNGGAFVTGLDFGLSGADGMYTLEYQSEDNVGNLEVLNSTAVFLDRTPPVTTLLAGATSFTAVDGTLYVKSGTPVSLTAVDPASGVDRIEISLDGGAFTAYAAALTFAEGRHTVQYRAVDKVGNEEDVAGRSIAVDDDAPGAPGNLLANGANPTPWSNLSSFNMTWDIPTDTAGVKGAHHHLDSLPEAFSASTNSLTLDFAGQLLNGNNLLTLWLEDNVGNQIPANSATAALRYDDVPPTSAAASTAATSTRPVTVNSTAQDPGADSIPQTGGGVDSVKLWVRRDTNGDGVYGAWALAAATSPAGSFVYDPGSQDGNLHLYTQAFDIAGNAEPAPLPATPPKAETFFDATPPALSNMRLPMVGYAQAQVAWQTDDQTTGVVEYGTTADFGHSRQTPLGREHLAVLDCQVLSPATIYYRITATNRTGLKTFSPIGSFVTDPQISIQTDLFGVVDPTHLIDVQVNNPSISSASFTIGGQSGYVVFSTSTGFQIQLDPSIAGSGVQTLRIVMGDFVYQTQFIVDTATRAVRLARTVFDAGGVMTDSTTTPGSSTVDMTLGETAQEEMSGSNSRIYLGYYAGIDPVAPAQIADLSAVTGPGVGQVTLSWTAVGDDADVGTAMKYDLRRATYPVDALNFSAASAVALSTLPASAGARQQAVIGGLSDGATHYFALKAEDELLNASPFGPSAAARTFDVARSADLTNSLPTVEFFSLVSGVSVTAVSSTTISSAVALATSAAAAQGLLFYTSLYDILSPDPSLPGGASIQFRYLDPGDLALEASLRVYEFKPALDQWVMIADVGPNMNQDLFFLSVPGLSFYAIMTRDAVPPVTSLEPRGGQLFQSDTGSLFASAATVYGLTSRDPPQGGFPGSGVSRSEFRVDSSSVPFTILSVNSSFSLPEGPHTAQFRSVDRAGNVEAARSALVTVDGAPPQVSLNTAQPSIPTADGLIVLSTFATVAVDVRDPLSIGGTLGSGSGVNSVTYTLDGSSPVFNAGSFSITLGAGAHVLALTAADRVGNVLDKSLRIVIGDILPPRTTVEYGIAGVGGDTVYLTSSTPITLRSVDDLLLEGDNAGLGVAFQEATLAALSSGTVRTFHFTSAISTFSASQETDGLFSLSFFAQDVAGNREAIKVATVAVDNTMPLTSMVVGTPSFLDAGLYVSALTPLVFSAQDPIVNGVASGLAETRFSIDGSSFTAYLSSFTLSGGTHAIAYFSQDRAGNAEVARSTAVLVDVAAPVTAVAIGSPTFTDSEGTVYVTSTTPVALTAADPVLFAGQPGAGLSYIEISVDSAPFAVYTTTLTFAEGRHTLAYRSADNVGNVEAVRILTLQSDVTPPLTTFTPSGTLFAGADGARFAPPSFSYGLPAADPVAGDVASGLAFTRYALDGGSFQTYATTFTLTEGVRRVDFQSQDNLGHLELLRSATVFVDATAPLTALGIGAPQFASGAILYVSTETPFSLASQDTSVSGVVSGVSGISFRLDAAAFGSYLSTFTIPAPDGPRSIAWSAMDNVGNVEAVKTTNVILDAAAPQSSLAVVGGRQAAASDAASFYASPDTRVTFTAVDPQAGGVASGLALVRYQDNGGAFQNFTVPLALGEGRHALRYQGQDNVLNLEVLRSTTVLVDATPPATAVSIGAPTFTAADGTIYVAPATPVAFTAADPALPLGEPGSGVERVEASVDGGVFASLSAPLIFSEGLHTVRYRASDRVGNVELERTLQLSSDATPPASVLEVGAPSFQLSSTTFLVGSLTPLSITAQDPVVSGVASGVKETFYRVSGVAPSTSAFQVFTTSFTLGDADTAGVVEFYSRDRVLNVEPVRSRAMLLDSTRPEAVIDSPRGGNGICSVVKGKVPVRGTARDLHFASYILESAPGRDAAAGFVLVSSGTSAVDAGLLGIWDARGLSGWQTLRLTVVDQVGNAAVVTFSVFVGDPGRLLVLGNHETFNLPQGVAADADGRIYVADTNDDQVQVFSATGTALVSFGRGHGRENDDDAGLRLNKPKGVAVDAAGAVYVADTNNDRVLKLSAAGQVLLEVGRRKPGPKDKDDDKEKGKSEPQEFLPGKDPGEFRKPSGVAVDGAGNIYVADTDNNRVQKLGPDGAPLLAFNMPPASGDGEDGDRDCERPELGRPVGIALDGAGNIYVADPRGARALKFSPVGQLLMTLPIHTENRGGHHKPGRPEGIAVSPDGGCVLVSDPRFSRVIRFDAAGVQTLEFGEPGKIRDNRPLPRRLVLRKPAGLALDAGGKLYVADRNNDRIQVFGLPSGAPTLVVPPSAHDRDDEHVAREVVDKEDGGRVERDDRAGVSIPAGALAEDLKITVSTPVVSDEGHRNRKRDDRNLKVVSAPVEYSPEGTKFKELVTLILPYTSDLIAAQKVDEDSLRIHYWNKEKGEWEALESEVDKENGTVKAKTPHFSLYQVMGSTGSGTAARPLAADASFGFKDMYAFPNPVRDVNAVTIRIQPGLADGVEVHVYDLAGRRIHASADFQQTILDDGNGKGAQYTYDHVWDVSGVGSGVYTYVITAKKSGISDIHKSGRIGVVK